jgi:dUTP pyrophosphatase
MLEVKVTKVYENAVIPKYETLGSAGMDLTAISESIDQTKDYGFIEYGTGLAMSIPEGYVGLLFPRSSISKTGMMLANAVGVIDSDYRGEIKFRFKYISGTTKYNVGDRIGQIIIVPYPNIKFLEVDDLDSTQRGSGSFGSTN